MNIFKAVGLIFLANCAAVASSQPASKPVVVETAKPKKFSISAVNPQDMSEEKDCVFVDYNESAKMRHFLFICNNSLIHVGMDK